MIVDGNIITGESILLDNVYVTENEEEEEEEERYHWMTIIVIAACLALIVFLILALVLSCFINGDLMRSCRKYKENHDDNGCLLYTSPSPRDS